MIGKIVKGIAGFYYVSVVESGIYTPEYPKTQAPDGRGNSLRCSTMYTPEYPATQAPDGAGEQLCCSTMYECKAKGIFRKEGKKPLVGDNVRIEVLDEDDKTANLVEILPRKNELIRPAVSNVDQAMVIFSLESPKPNGALLDRFLIMMEKQGVPVFICFNKEDLVSLDEAEHWKKIYRSCGYDVLLCSAGDGKGLDEIETRLTGRTTVVAGPSGVGKSTITNLMQTEICMETGEISRKLKRGKHTTRHSQLIPLGGDTYLCDTPGFTSLYTAEMDKEELRNYFPEFVPFEGGCRFQGCVHVNEPDCRIKEAVEAGKISSERYENYRMFYEELKEKEKRRY